MEPIKVKIYKSLIVTCITLTFFIFIGCKDNSVNESALIKSIENISNIEIIDNIKSEEMNNQIEGEEPVLDEMLVGYEGEWYRTDVASYEWARIKISNWVEGESFDVLLLANYADYGGPVEGTASFIAEDMAVVYDENLVETFPDQEGDYGVYFQFVEDTIIVTHDGKVRLWFGGSGIVTAEGTYIQGEPEYTNCTDVSQLYTLNELNTLQELLGEDYETLFEGVIEFGKIDEYSIANGRLWKAEYPPYGAVWCNILIYDDGSYFVEGRYWNEEYKFYTNTDATEMPDIKGAQKLDKE